MKKSILAAIVSICLIFSASMPAVAFASVGDGIIQPMWTNASGVMLNLSYSGGKVSWGGKVSGNANVTSISATFKIEKLNSSGKYESFDSKTASSSSSILSTSGSKTGTKGTYRITVTATVKTSSGTSETITDSLVKTI